MKAMRIGTRARTGKGRRGAVRTKEGIVKRGRKGKSQLSTGQDP